MLPPPSPQRLAACLLVALAGADAHALVYTVGSAAGCTHSTIQQAIAAAEASPGLDTIRISREIAHTAQALVINTSQELELHGGFATCAQTTSDGQTTIDGAGGATEPVMRITVGTNGVVRLRGLQIRGGDEDGGGHGGGIFFRGNGRLEIRDSDIINNLAGYGGGIYAEGLGNAALLVIGANVSIANNTARFSGGGIYVDGMTLRMIDPGSWIGFNKAQGLTAGGYGGGLMVLSRDRPALAIVGSGGVEGLGTIFANEARFGGGVAIVGGEDSFYRADLRLFTTDPARRTVIRENFASVAGGGIYALPYDDAFPLPSTAPAKANIWNADIIDNVAPSGAAVHLDHDTDGLGDPFGSELYFNTSVDTTRPAEAAQCPQGGHCGRIAGNLARDGNGQPSGGAVLHLGRYSRFNVQGPSTVLAPGGVWLQDNEGGRLLDTLGDDSDLILRTVLISGNRVDQQLLRAQNGPQRIDIDDSTISGNQIGASHVLAINGNFNLRRSIIWQPGKTTLLQSGGSRLVEHAIASETTSLGGPPAAVATPPRFIDPANGDFRLRAASPAIDYLSEIPGNDRDADGRLRDVRLPDVPRQEGAVRDIGAFERQALQPLVLNANFDIDLNHWQEVSAGTSWDPSQNWVGAVGSGSLGVSAPSSPGARVVARSQCIHLPGPGLYRLNGFGRSGFGLASERDALIIAWQFRSDGGEACNSGPVDLGGDHFLTTLNTWTRPEQPAEIAVPGSDWTTNSSIALQLVVVERGVTAQGQATGWFDGIALHLSGFGPQIFRDGFEGP
jgi:predicted outer membrane repeat protein